MPKHKGKRETIGLSDLIVGLTTGDTSVVKKITRRGSKNRLALMTIASLSKTSTSQQKTEAHGEIKYALIKQTGHAIDKKVKKAFEDA